MTDLTSPLSSLPSTYDIAVRTKDGRPRFSVLFCDHLDLIENDSPWTEDSYSWPILVLGEGDTMPAALEAAAVRWQALVEACPDLLRDPDVVAREQEARVDKASAEVGDINDDDDEDLEDESDGVLDAIAWDEENNGDDLPPMRAEVRAFALLMDERLVDTDNPRGVPELENEEVIERLRDAVDELRTGLGFHRRMPGMPRQNEGFGMVREAASALGNLAMIAAYRCGVLRADDGTPMGETKGEVTGG